MSYPLSILARSSRWSMGSRFTLPCNKRSHVICLFWSKKQADKQRESKCTHSVSLFARKSGQTVEASVSLRGGSRSRASQKYAWNTLHTDTFRGLASCNMTDYLGSRLSRHAPGTIGSGSTLRMQQHWLGNMNNKYKKVRANASDICVLIDCFNC